MTLAIVYFIFTRDNSASELDIYHTEIFPVSHDKA